MLETLATTWLSLPDYARSTAWILVITVVLIVCVALLTLWERKVIGWMQLRRGPNRVRLFGLLPGVGQPFADVIKLLVKEVIIPTNSNKFLFRLAPIVALVRGMAADLPRSAPPAEWLRLLAAGEEAKRHLREALAVRGRARELQAEALMLSDLPISH